MFIRDFLTVKTKVISSMTELYFDFKKFDEAYGKPREELLAEMLKYAEYYYQASKGATPCPKVNKTLRQLANLGSTVCMPFYIQFLDFAAQTSLDEDEIYSVFDVVENYWARRVICGYPANVMSKTFAIIHSDILRIMREHQRREVELTSTYSELLKFVLLRKQGNAVFPTDTQVENEFHTRQIYKIPIDYRYFLFERMENENSKEANDLIVQKMKDNQITIEHIMPQTLTLKWKEDLGENWEEIYNTYLHTFANLTLTGYNSSYGNHTFQEKKEGYVDHKGKQIFGFKDSAFRLSNYLKTCDKWTLEELTEREKILLNKFFGLWPMATTNYTPLENEADIVSFNDDELELTGRYISAFSYKGQRYQVYNWKQMLEKICKLIYAEYPIQMNSLAVSDYWLHLTDSEDRSRITDNCYVYSSCSTKTKCTVLNYIFSQLEINPSDLEFELIPKSEKLIEDSEDIAAV